MKDMYKTISCASDETLFKEKGSKFFGYAYQVNNENDVKKHLLALRKQHHSASHFCYAYQIGVEKPKFRVNDDGEPNNSAGMPIYGQILSFELTNILVVVVRYFGGTKLGVGGLISAYKSSAQLTLDKSKIITKTINVHFKIQFGYDKMNIVQRIIKEKSIKIVSQTLELKCTFIIVVRKKEAATIFKIFDDLYQVDITELIS